MSWEFLKLNITNPNNTSSFDDFPNARSFDYTPDLDWSWEDGVWGEYPELTIRGGGRYRNNIIVFGLDVDGKGEISWV